MDSFYEKFQSLASNIRFSSLPAVNTTNNHLARNELQRKERSRQIIWLVFCAIVMTSLRDELGKLLDSVFAQ